MEASFSDLQTNMNATLKILETKIRPSHIYERPIFKVNPWWYREEPRKCKPETLREIEGPYTVEIKNEDERLRLRSYQRKRKRQEVEKVIPRMINFLNHTPFDV